MAHIEHAKPEFIVRRSVDVAADDLTAGGRIWKPGAFRRFPWKGLGSVVLAIAGIGGCVAILIISSESPVRSWSFSPAVYLAIVVAVVNILVHYALTEGAAIQWWYQALQNKTTVGDLHRNWDQGNSFLSALFAGRRSTLLGLATVLVTITPINGPLL
ncbi:hypothetical protein FH972_022199 [Carpinus fangiana]|uniref:Uncharacterized protein n=1 Tax=Carpinus fangiana TaxID=176857 RepID=A0A5N6KRJ3_9ROSI|nr:hypothetical protein FH972_022199 [Carpinus fangiana]